MKILFSLLFFASLGWAQVPIGANSPTGGVAKYTRVGIATHEASASSSCATPSTVHTAGNLLVFLATSFGNANTVSSVVGTSDTYTAAANSFNSSGGVLKQTVIYYKLIHVGSGAEVVTINWNLAGAVVSCTVIEYSYSGTALYDVGANGGASAVNTVTSGSFTTATASNLNLAIGAQQVGAVNGWAAGPGYTLIQNTGTTVNAEIEEYNPPPSGSQTAAITYNTATSDMQISVASFK